MALNCDIEQTPLAVYTSDWVFANPLPIIFDLESDLYPTNNVDAVLNYTSVTGSNGYAKITLDATNSGYECGDWIKLTGTYSGTFRITSAVSTSIFVLDTPYITTGTGTAQKSYMNYYVSVRVYAGIPSGHYYASENPTELVTTLQVRPDLDNIARVDVSSAVRSKFLKIDNDVCGQVESTNEYLNDRKAWVGFYIEYAETYQTANDCVTSTYTSSYTQTQTYYALNGTSQFQYAHGNNAGEYVVNNNNLTLPSKFLTTIENPIIYDGKEMDMAIILPTELFIATPLIEVLLQNQNYDTYTITISNTYDTGVYRILLGDVIANLPNSDYVDVSILIDNSQSSEIKRVLISSDCSQYEGKHITYLNTLGGWDYIFMGAGQVQSYESEDTQSIERNIFGGWSANFVSATTQTDNVRRKSKSGGKLRSFRLSKATRDAIAQQLMATVKVQEIIELAQDVSCLDVKNRRTIIPSGSYSFEETDKQYFINLDYKDTAETLSQWQ